MKKRQRKSGNKPINLTEKIVLITAVVELIKTLIEIIRDLTG